jgi:mRNA-degrading endonuclease toxin of MazEF toxin-antitoxin module
MLYATTFSEVITDTWRDDLSHGDIVLFRFPLSEGGEDAEIKARPCLVLDIETIGDARYAVIVYGTTSRRKANVGEEIHVSRRDAYTAAGLNEPTRFVGARRILVPLTHKGFVEVSNTGSPVLGHLVDSEFDRLNAVRGRIHTLRDIATERHSKRRRRTHLGLRPMREVTVEYRELPPRIVRKGAAK